MANTFKLKTKANVGTTTADVYVVPSSTTCVVIGVTLSNTSGSGINVGIGTDYTLFSKTDGTVEYKTIQDEIREGQSDTLIYILEGGHRGFHKYSEDFRKGDLGVICSFGAGYSVGSIIVQKT